MASIVTCAIRDVSFSTKHCIFSVASMFIYNFLIFSLSESDPGKPEAKSPVGRFTRNKHLQVLCMALKIILYADQEINIPIFN